MSEIGEEIFEMLPTLVSVAFGSILTLAITRFTEIVEKSKKLSINCKFIHTKGREHHPFEYDLLEHEDKQILYIPLRVDIVNDSNISKVCRNLSVFSYKNGQEVEEIKQIQQEDENDNTYYYGDEGKYTFVIEPNSVRSYDLLYMAINFEMDIDSFVIQYSNDKNKIIKYKLIELDEDWKQQLIINYNNKWFSLEQWKKYI